MTAQRGDFDRPSAAVPGPRFRDQLAEALRERRDNPAITGDRERDYRPGAPCMDCGDYPGLRHEASDCPRAVARFVERFVASEVEARVEAAARPDVMHFPAYGCDWGGCDDDSLYLRWAPDLGQYLGVCEKHKADRLTLAQPAPGTDT